LLTQQKIENSIHGTQTIKNSYNYDKWNVNCSKKGSELREDFVNLVKNITHNYKDLLVKLKLYEKHPKELNLMKLQQILN